jgi:DmsE family decaheme c-type cytochrome
VTKRLPNSGSMPSGTTTVKSAIILLFVGLLLAVLGRDVLPPTFTSSTTAQAAITGDVGQDCRKCHTEIVEAFASNIHGKSGNFTEGERSTSCDSCHGSPEKHVRSRKKEDIINPARLPASEVNSSCLQCHSQDKHTFAWKGSEHDQKDISCISCHSQHHYRSEEKMLTNATTEDTCLSCHTDVRKALFQRSTHLYRTELRNMKVGCSSCHNPHGGDGDKMLVEQTVNNVCYACHAEKRGPFLWDHPPVRENCMNCHAPHGSNNAKLLTARASMSCQQCHIHMLPRHSTTVGKSMDIWTLNRGCMNCHSQVHGSNHPGGRTLTR